MWGSRLQHSHPPAFKFPAASLGSECFARFHALLAAATWVRYVLRPVLLTAGCAGACGDVGGGERLALAGYGVGLALKNMEYVAIDDAKVKDKEGDEDAAATAALGADRQQGEEADVGGFLLPTLLARRPDLSEGLLSFREHMLAQAAAGQTADGTAGGGMPAAARMRAWELKDLGVQAAQRVLQAAEPLRLLADLAQNLPDRAAALARMRVNATLRAQLASTQKQLQGGITYVQLNGALPWLRTPQSD